MAHIQIDCTQDFEDGPRILESMEGRSRVLLEVRAVAFRAYVKGMRGQPIDVESFTPDFLAERVLVDKFYPVPVGLEFLQKLTILIDVANITGFRAEPEAYLALFEHKSQNLHACVFFTGATSGRLVFWDIGEAQAMKARLSAVASASNAGKFLKALRDM